MLNRTMKTAAVALAVALAMLVGLIGCAGGDSQGSAQDGSPAQGKTEAATDTSATVPKPDTSANAAYTVEAGDEGASASFILQNDAEMQPVFGIEVRPSSDDPEAAYTECPFTVGDRLVPGMRCLVRYDAAGDLYDVRVTYADGSEGVFSGIALADLSNPLHVGLAEDGSVVFS